MVKNLGNRTTTTSLIRALGLGGLFLAANTAWAAPRVLYPKVCGVKGLVQSEDRHGVKKRLKPRQVLFDRTILRTDAQGRLCLDLNAQDRLILAADSEITLPGMAMENGRVADLVLEKGRFRLISRSDEVRTLSSPLMRETFHHGDIVVGLSREKALARVELLKGEMSFRGLENEESVTLTEGETVEFKGEVLDGVFQFDVLLQGRKVARGTLGEVKKLTDKDLERLKAEFSLTGLKTISQEDQEAQAVQTGRRPRKKTSGKPSPWVCEKPNGRFNQCAYICENNPVSAKVCRLDLKKVKCARFRCNANGFWEERFEYTAERSPCLAKPLVKECDY